jgi:protein-disulfide isomerase
MVNASQTGEQLDENGAGNFIVYADFNCSFCYALNERLHAMNLDQRVEFRAVQHAPASSSSDNGFEILSELTSEVAELRRRAPSIPVNVPLFRPSTAAAAALVNAVNDSDPVKAGLLRRQIYRALWVDGQDISRSEVLNGLLQELEIEPPAPDDLRDDELIAWQSEWDCSPEFDRSIPVLINGSGETVIGFPLQPELDSFLQTGSMVSDGSVTGVTEPQDRQRILVLDRDVPSLRMIIGQMQDAQVEIVENFSSLVASAVNLGMPDLVIVDTALLGGVDSTDNFRFRRQDH